MDRPKRAAAKVTDFRRYHLSGDLDNQLKGQVDLAIQHLEMTNTAEDLRRQLESEREHSKQLQEEVEMIKMHNELALEKQKQAQWHSAMEQIKEAREHADREHEKCLEQMKELTATSKGDSSSEAIAWLQAQVRDLHKTSEPDSDRVREAKEAEIQDLKNQQEAINKKLRELTGTSECEDQGDNPHRATQQNAWMEQLRAALSGKREEDPNKALLKALITSQNKKGGEGELTPLNPIYSRASSAATVATLWLTG